MASPPLRGSRCSKRSTSGSFLPCVRPSSVGHAQVLFFLLVTRPSLGTLLSRIYTFMEGLFVLRGEGCPESTQPRTGGIDGPSSSRTALVCALLLRCPRKIKCYWRAWSERTCSSFPGLCGEADEGRITEGCNKRVNTGGSPVSAPPAQV